LADNCSLTGARFVCHGSQGVVKIFGKSFSIGGKLFNCQPDVPGTELFFSARRVPARYLFLPGFFCVFIPAHPVFQN